MAKERLLLAKESEREKEKDRRNKISQAKKAGQKCFAKFLCHPEEYLGLYMLCISIGLAFLDHGSSGDIELIVSMPWTVDQVEKRHSHPSAILQKYVNKPQDARTPHLKTPKPRTLKETPKMLI